MLQRHKFDGGCAVNNTGAMALNAFTAPECCPENRPPSFYCSNEFYALPW